jgi:hypothetical protein
MAFPFDLLVSSQECKAFTYLFEVSTTLSNLCPLLNLVTSYNVRLAIWFLFLLHYLQTTSFHNISFHVLLSYNNRSYYVCDTNFLDNELRFIFLDLFVNSICIKHFFFPNQPCWLLHFSKNHSNIFTPPQKDIYVTNYDTFAKHFHKLCFDDGVCW